MRLRPALAAVAAGALALAAVAGARGQPPGAAGRPAARPPAPAVRISPDAIHAAGPSSQPPTTASCERDYHIACYSPAQIRQAYQLPALLASGITGAAQTIVIVDSF